MATILLIAPDWEKMFVPSVSLLEIILRGTLTYWFCLFYIRIFKRGAGQLSLSDLLLITLISDAAQNSMAAEYHSVTEGFVLVGTLACWNYGMAFLGFQSDLFRRVIDSDPVLLVKDGVLQRQNLKKELIGRDELMGMLREQGVDELDTVKTCYIESSGNISVVTKSTS